MSTPALVDALVAAQSQPGVLAVEFGSATLAVRLILRRTLNIRLRAAIAILLLSLVMALVLGAKLLCLLIYTIRAKAANAFSSLYEWGVLGADRQPKINVSLKLKRSLLWKSDALVLGHIGLLFIAFRLEDQWHRERVVIDQLIQKQFDVGLVNAAIQWTIVSVGVHAAIYRAVVIPAILLAICLGTAAFVWLAGFGTDPSALGILEIGLTFRSDVAAMIAVSLHGIMLWRMGLRYLERCLGLDRSAAASPAVA